MNRYSKFIAASVLGLTVASNAQAAGYQLSDYSVAGLGRSYAGAGVVGDDYSALAYNPAGMFANPKTGMQVGATLVQQYGKVKGTDSFGKSGKDDISVYSPLPNFFAQYKINDDLMAGFGVYMPYGLASDYGDDFFASGEGITTDLRIVDLNLSAAYKMTDTFSIGAGLIYRYVRGKVTGYARMPGAPGSLGTGAKLGYYNYDLDNWNWYGNFGVMWEPVKDTRIGVSYRPTRHHKVEGPLEIGGAPALLPGIYDAQSTQVLPEQVIISAFTKQNNFGYSFMARWSRWTRFQKFTMTAPSYPSPTFRDKTAEYRWHNTWTVSLGADWYYNDTWTFRAGVAYDQSPATDGNYRTTRIPDQSRYWVSLGTTYNINKNSRIDVGYAHLFMRTYHARNGANAGAGAAPNMDVKYDAQANIIGVQYQYDF